MGALVVFSPDVDRLADFYEAVIGAQRNREASDIRLLNDRDEVLVHSIPKKIAELIERHDPPIARDGSPLKPVFDVDSMEVALRAVLTTGGAITDTAFSFAGLDRHDVVDPDGNVIQLRSVTT